MAHANHNNDGKKTGDFLNFIPTLMAGLAILILLIWIKSIFSGDEEPADAVQPTGAVDTSNVSAREPLLAQYNEKPSCPPLSSEGATCEVTPSCSGWIREAPGSPAGLTHYFQPEVGTPAYKSVRWLDKDGEPHVLADGEVPSGVVAWELCPDATITVSYSAI